MMRHTSPSNPDRSKAPGHQVEHKPSPKCRKPRLTQISKEKQQCNEEGGIWKQDSSRSSQMAISFGLFGPRFPPSYLGPPDLFHLCCRTFHFSNKTILFPSQSLHLLLPLLGTLSSKSAHGWLLFVV